MAELHFADEAAYLTAMSSPENRVAGKELRQFAADRVTLATVKEG
jgi:hypothetical protein